MELQIVNRDPKYTRVPLAKPTALGYIHLAARVSPRPLPFWPNGLAKKRLLRTLKSLADRIEALPTVESATVFDGVLFPPTHKSSRYLQGLGESLHVPRYDVVVLIETSSPQTIRAVTTTAEYAALVETLESQAREVHVLPMRNAKRVGDVDKTRKGLFLFNYFVADDATIMLDLWEFLAGWYKAEAGLDNSTLLEPLDSQASRYTVINSARWDRGLVRFLTRTILKKSFRSYILANLEAHRAGSLPVLYRLA